MEMLAQNQALERSETKRGSEARLKRESDGLSLANTCAERRPLRRRRPPVLRQLQAGACSGYRDAVSCAWALTAMSDIASHDGAYKRIRMDSLDTLQDSLDIIVSGTKAIPRPEEPSLVSQSRGLKCGYRLIRVDTMS
jgi:hypothetical protein